ncbi:MAG: GDP-mannose 4,6-dehydratase [Actinobacteria bacterium]|nr:GDP-mannose 4,6-dehydratase [Actinomycetota bacterium]MCG2802808.1 GDP-mannose 4,6-dehydratase [Cellulomonas sp.]
MPVAFVTGISGQDGTILARRLVAEGVVVHGLVRSHSELATWSQAERDQVVAHIGELTDTERVAQLVDETEPDEVYNLAGVSSVAYSWEHPVLTGQVTGVGAVGVYEACWRLAQRIGRAVRVVQASSSEIFGRPTRSPQDENTPVAPISPYGAAKAYAHLSGAVYRERGLPVSTAILYNHESPLRPTRFVTRKITAAAARIARDGGELVLGDTTVRRDWGWAPDYVDAMVRAVRHETPGDYVVATGQEHSVEDFIEAAMTHAGVHDWRARVRTDPALVRPADTAAQVGDASRARAVLGWRPTVDFSDLVARMVDHDLALLSSGGGGRPPTR